MQCCKAVRTSLALELAPVRELATRGHSYCRRDACGDPGLTLLFFFVFLFFCFFLFFFALVPQARDYIAAQN